MRLGVADDFADFYIRPDESAFSIIDAIWHWSVAEADVEYSAHWHGYFVIPTGIVDGINKVFAISARQAEAIVNGLKVDATLEDDRLVLDVAPRTGDFFWCQVIY